MSLIFYFSATGNCGHVAERISEATGARTVAIDRCLAENRTHFDVEATDAVGFVFPVYFGGMPHLVHQFLTALTLSHAPSYIYGVATYGSMIGAPFRQLRQRLGERGLRLDASFAVRMVDVWTPMFDLSDPAKTLATTRAAEPVIEKVVEQVKACTKGVGARSWVPVWFSRLLYLFYRPARSTRHFRLRVDRCTGCGLCAKNCPDGAICMTSDRRPDWTRDRCDACLRCLHHCPTFAIQRGKRTEGHGQYTYGKCQVASNK